MIVMRFVRFSLLTLGLCLAWASDGAAQSVVARIDADSVSIGERATLVVYAAHDGARRAVFPDEITTPAPPPEAVGTVGDFELLRRRSAGSRTLADGSRLDSVVYESTTFAVDTAYVAARVGFASERDTVSVAGPPLLVPVRSVVPDSTQDVRDLAPIAEFPRPIWPWLLVLALVGAIVWLWYRFRRRPDAVDEEPAAPPPPPEPPAEEAMRRLDALSSTPLDLPEALKPYFVELSDILRTYVQRRMDIHALELTTSELIQAMRSRKGPRMMEARIAEMDQILRAADLVKFADAHPPADRARSALEATRVTIRRTEADVKPVLMTDEPGPVDQPVAGSGSAVPAAPPSRIDTESRDQE